MLPRLLVIPCAGSGERFRKSGGQGRKQLLDLAGLPIFLHTLSLFHQHGGFAETVLVISEEDESVIREWLSGPVLTARGLPSELARTRLVHGGRERFESVYAGLRALPTAPASVFIHDAARPLLHPHDLGRLVSESERMEIGLLPGEALRDTVKGIDASGWVTSSPARRSLMAVSTPQIFPLVPLLEAYEAMWRKPQSPAPTDDAEVFTRHGGKVKVLPLEHPNPKITTAEDLEWARLLLSRRA